MQFNCFFLNLFSKSWKGLKIYEERVNCEVRWTSGSAFLMHCIATKALYLFGFIMLVASVISLGRGGTSRFLSRNVLSAQRRRNLTLQVSAAIQSSKEKSAAEISEGGYVYDPKKIRNFSIIAHIGIVI